MKASEKWGIVAAVAAVFFLASQCDAAPAGGAASGGPVDVTVTSCKSTVDDLNWIQADAQVVVVNHDSSAHWVSAVVAFSWKGTMFYDGTLGVTVPASTTYRGDVLSHGRTLNDLVWTQSPGTFSNLPISCVLAQPG